MIGTNADYLHDLPRELEDISALSPEIGWGDIGRFRDFVVHHYFKLDLSKVWEIVHTDLPPLKAAVEKLLPELEENDDAG